MAANAKASVDGWIKQLLDEDFAASCKEDRFCVTCAAAFCDHCCAEHYRGQGHEVIVRTAASGANGGPARRRSRALRGQGLVLPDCAAGFSASLCAHHGGHETVGAVVR